MACEESVQTLATYLHYDPGKKGCNLFGSLTRGYIGQMPHLRRLPVLSRLIGS